MIELILNFKNYTKTVFSKNTTQAILINKLSKIKKRGIFEISATLCGQKRIWALNKKYRNIDRPTDVLSFGQDRLKAMADQPVFLGDIVISVKEAKKNAKKYRRSFEEEMEELLYHGLKHLLGYHHKE